MAELVKQNWGTDVAAFGPETAVEAEPPLVRRGGGGGSRRAAPAGRNARGRRQLVRFKLPAWAEILFYIAFSLLLTSLIKTFFVQMYYIPSPSMEPYTYKGDRVFVDKLSPWFGSEPARSDIVVFHDPHHWLVGANVGGGGPVLNLLAAVGVLPDQHDDLLIKRIIGVSGDTVECKSSDGPVLLNGKPLDEDYIMNGKQGQPCHNGVYKVTVPKGHLWLLGDNRTESADSSFNYIKNGGDKTPNNDAGFVPTGNVVGHVVGVVSWLRDDAAVKQAPKPKTDSAYVSNTGH
jgi:signal peptidase I